jgi:putative endonuclease
MLNKKYSVYVLRCVDGTFYTGITNDINRRVLEHNTSKRGARYTRSRRPVKLVYTKNFRNRSYALKAEAAIKKLTRKEKTLLIKKP